VFEVKLITFVFYYLISKLKVLCVMLNYMLIWLVEFIGEAGLLS